MHMALHVKTYHTFYYTVPNKTHLHHLFSISHRHQLMLIETIGSKANPLCTTWQTLWHFGDWHEVVYVVDLLEHFTHFSKWIGLGIALLVYLLEILITWWHASVHVVLECHVFHGLLIDCELLMITVQTVQCMTGVVVPCTILTGTVVEVSFVNQSTNWNIKITCIIS